MYVGSFDTYESTENHTVKETDSWQKSTETNMDVRYWPFVIC